MAEPTGENNPYVYRRLAKVPGAVLSPDAKKELQKRLLECSIAEHAGMASLMGATNIGQIGTAQRQALQAEIPTEPEV